MVEGGRRQGTGRLDLDREFGVFHPRFFKFLGLISGLFLFSGCSGSKQPSAFSTTADQPPAPEYISSETTMAGTDFGAEPAMERSNPPAPEFAYGAKVRAADGKTVVLVPAGEFTMGAADDDPEAGPNEKPEHRVFVDAFWIDQTETTNGQFRKCVQAGICRPPEECDFGLPTYADGKKTDHPVVCVTWYDAVEYCAWAGGRLPTEAEWEKAARGMGGRRYPWGDGIDCERGNFRGCPQFMETAPVGSFPAGISPYGALDMSGNVWEWVGDWMGWDYYGISPYLNPTGPERGDMRIVRGGSWRYEFPYMRVATRHCAPPEHQADALGFRCIIPENEEI
jgi:formylglycine-generating enzyme required for sulfatase activity